jgi:fumarate hydratase subunit beta
MIHLTTPLTAEKSIKLLAGDEIFLTGEMYLARDAAHVRLIEHLNNFNELPFSLKDSIIYYAGPSPSSPNRKAGSIGPTTSMRMDQLSEPLLKQGLRGTVGKGERSPELRKLLCSYQSVYFVTIGGAGSLLSTRVKSIETILYEDLGPEAIYLVKVENFPLFVAYDTHGNSLFP